MMSVLLWACASGQAAEPHTAADASRVASPSGPKSRTAQMPETKSTPSAALAAPHAAKTSALVTPGTCTPTANAAPKTVAGDSEASEVAETGTALIFDVAGISVELPACTPDADARVITVSWETKDRPNATHIDPNFTRHAATLRVDRPLTARDGAPLLVRLHSKRELAKRGEKLVLAVENSGECDEKHKRDRLEYGDCSHWKLYDASYDEERNEMVARIPALGGYRLQFGWMPAK